MELEKLYEMNVTEISMFGKESTPNFDMVIDFDENNNMYILDRYECKIWVFDENGKFLRTFGGKGEGPGEFLMPHALVVKRDKIYVFYEWFKYKILTLEGKYVFNGMAQIENPLKYETVGNDFYIFRGKVDRTFTKLQFILLRIENDNFSNAKEIFKYKYPPGFGAPNYDFYWANWLLLTDNGKFYFPEDNLNKYSIIKYNKNGKPVLIFGREYSLKKYSKEARERFYSLYEREIKRGDRVFPEFPPVVRKMFQDKRKNIWIIVGETYEDNENPTFENTIDIFNEKGEWLYSFKSKVLSRYCIYHNGKIYRVLPINPKTYEQYIEVYKIRYFDK